MKFIKETEEINYPYDRSSYFAFLDEEKDSVRWYGYSLQLALDDIEETYNKLSVTLKKLVKLFSNAGDWVVNHDDKNMSWFLDNDQNLPLLREVFKTNNIPNDFKGFLILSEKELLHFANDLIQYPSILSYKDLDLSHPKIPMVIKITSHMTLDIMTPDKKRLEEVLENDTLLEYKKVQYREV